METSLAPSFAGGNRLARTGSCAELSQTGISLLAPSFEVKANDCGARATMSGIPRILTKLRVGDEEVEDRDPRGRGVT
jgi:hypothetical protein